MTKTSDQDKSPFTSPPSKKTCCKKKIKQSLPQTPRRRSRVLQKLPESPTSKQALENKGILSSTSRQQKMGRILHKSLGEQLNTVKYSAGASSARRAACKILKDVINKSDQYGSKSLLRKELGVRKRKSAKKVMSCVTKTSTLEELMEAYASDLEELPGYLFRADWQHQQMKLCILGLQEDEACICMDYPKN